MFCIVLLFSPAASKFLGNYTKSCAKIQNNVYIKYDFNNYPLEFDPINFYNERRVEMLGNRKKKNIGI